MEGYRFSTAIAVRYADLDAQGHMNHARYFSFMEEARFRYIQALGLWTDTTNFEAVGQIVAEAACTYLRPVRLGQTVDVAVRVSRVGGKSLEMEYHLSVDGQPVATGRTVQVAYDYVKHATMPVPDDWRRRVRAFEGWPEEKV